MIFLALWSTLFLETWKRRQSELAHSWGVMNTTIEHVPRPQFRGNVKLDLWTKKTDYKVPKRSVRARIISVPIILVFVALSCVVTIYILLYKSDFKADSGGGGSKAWFTGGALSTGLLCAVAMMIFDQVGQNLSLLLTTKENHKTYWGHEKSLRNKFVTFQLFNFYLALFWTAFHGDYGGLCVASSEAALIYQQCVDLHQAGYGAPDDICAQPEKIFESADKQNQAQQFILYTVKNIDPSELRRIGSACLGGTTMHSLFLIFLIIYTTRLISSIFVQYVYAPLVDQVRGLSQELYLRTRVRDRAIDRLTKRKMLMERQKQKRMNELQARTTDILPMPPLASQADERKNVSLLANARGLYGLVIQFLEWRRQRKEARQQRRAKKKAEIDDEGDDVEEVEVEGEELEAFESEDFRQISFDISIPGLESKM
eukprot:763532-Hanusia_phi.AAC.2